MFSKAQTKLQLVPRIRITVRSQLIAPSAVVLGATETLRFVSREKFNSGTVGEDDFTVVAVPSLKHSVSTQNA